MLLIVPRLPSLVTPKWTVVMATPATATHEKFWAWKSILLLIRALGCVASLKVGFQYKSACWHFHQTIRHRYRLARYSPLRTPTLASSTINENNYSTIRLSIGLVQSYHRLLADDIYSVTSRTPQTLVLATSSSVIWRAAK